MDSDSALLRAAVLSVRAGASLPDSAVASPRPGDNEWHLLRKLFLSLCEKYEVGGAVTQDESELGLWRKVLSAIRYGEPALPVGGAYAWRSGDSQHNVMAKVLRCLCSASSDTDPLHGPMPGDSERNLLWKIVQKF